MRLNIKRFEFLKKRKGKTENKRITNTLIHNETGIKIYSLDDYVRFTNGVQHPISEKSAKTLSKYFDCHPGYLVGTINEKAKDIYPVFKSPKSEAESNFIDMIRSEWDYVIDDDGYFIPPYRDYEYEEMRNLNIQDFEHWLLSINMFENPDFLDGFPSNAIMKNILSKMSYGEMQIFQGKIIEAVSEYLTVHGYISDLGGYLLDESQLDEKDIDRLEEESNRQWVKKRNESIELYHERIKKEGE